MECQPDQRQDLGVIDTGAFRFLDKMGFLVYDGYVSKLANIGCGNESLPKDSDWHTDADIASHRQGQRKLVFDVSEGHSTMFFSVEEITSAMDDSYKVQRGIPLPSSEEWQG